MSKLKLEIGKTYAVGRKHGENVTFTPESACGDHGSGMWYSGTKRDGNGRRISETTFREDGAYTTSEMGTSPEWSCLHEVVPVQISNNLTVNVKVEETPVDEVNNPAHYTAGGIECIEAIRAALTPEEFRGYCKGNMIKYIWRERHKQGNVSIEKAQWYAKAMLGG